VVDEDLLAAVLEMRMAVRSTPAPAAPARRLLLRDADQHHAEATLALGGPEVVTRDLLLGLAPAKAQHRNPVALGVAIDRRHVGAADLAQQRRRRDRVASIQQKPHDLKLRHQLRHVSLQEQPVDRPHPQRHVISQ
jgi:hypothetical protein